MRNEITLIVWKNLLTRRRHWVLTIFEILLPVTLFILTACGRSQMNGLNKIKVDKPVFHDKITEESLYSDIPYEYFMLLYAPSSKFAEDIIRQFQVKFNIPSEFVQGFGSRDDILTYHKEHYKDIGEKLMVSVVFNGNNTKHLDYDLSVYEKYLDWHTDKNYGPLFISENPYINSLQYIEKSFVAIQMAINRGFLEYSLHVDNLNLTISLQQFPYPPHLEDPNLEFFFNYLLPLLTTLSFLFTALTILNPMMEEKESGVQSLLEVHGMKSWMTLVGRVIDNVPINLISISAITGIMKLRLWGVEYAPIEYCSGFVFFIFLFLYYLSSLTYCFLLSSLFTKPSVALTTSILFWILSYLTSQFISNIMEALDWEYKMLTGILPNMALHYGYKTISIYEARGINVQLDNINEPTFGSSNDITMCHVFGMFLGNILLTIIFVISFKNIIGELLISFIRYLKTKSGLSKSSSNNEMKELQSLIESSKETSHIEIRNLTKKYKGHYQGVENLNLRIYKNQITVLMGENGAGKTTFVQMIAGMLQPSSGSIILSGQNVTDNKKLTKQKIGYCSQHNLLFPSLTTSEHLILFAMLKGKSFSEARAESKEIMKKLNLLENCNSYPHQLSGGMKRKLCFGIAMAGGNELLILDEPTAGMDYESRYSIRDILREIKKERTIIITTHFMDEVETLADWICILYQGQLQYYATPAFLKNEFYTGYLLSFTLQEDRNTMLLIEMLKKDIVRYEPNVKVVSTKKDTIILSLPTLSSYTKLFINIENITKYYKIKKTSLKFMSIDEVFARAKIRGDEITQSQNGKNSYSCQNDSYQELIKILNPGENENRATLFGQMKALLWKRTCFTIRKTHVVLNAIFTVTIICAVLFLLTIACIKYNGEATNPVNLNLGNYGKTLVYFNASSDLIESFVNVVSQQNCLPTSVQNVSQAIITKGIENIAFYKKNMIVAAEISEEQGTYNLNCLFSLDALHSPPISLNLAMNAIVKYYLGNDYSITVRNVPLNGHFSEFISSEISPTDVAILWYLLIPTAFLSLMSTFILFPIYEIPNNFAYLQHMAGIRMWFYWSVHIIFHLMLTAIEVFLILVVLIGINVFFTSNYFGLLELGAICTIFFSSLPSILFSTYLFSFKKTSSAAYIILALLLMGLIPTFIVYLLENLGSETFAAWLKAVVMCLCPPSSMNYLFIKFIRKFAENYNWKHLDSKSKQQYCISAKNPCCNTDDDSPVCRDYMSYFINEKYGISADLTLLLISSVIFLLILILALCNWHVIKLSIIDFYDQYIRVKKNNSQNNSSLDSTEISTENLNQLQINNIQKTIKKLSIVENVKFNITGGNCVGLLGRNGDGKTTTMNMLSGQLPPDKGEISLRFGGKELRSYENSYCTKIGYCPQADALNMAISGRELIQTFFMMKGVKDVTAATEELLKLFDLEKCANRPCKQYSGGNRRKLNIAIALIGLPSMLLLDEPTCGIDPLFRRKFWDILKWVKTKNIGILLTSHSMDEYEALADSVYTLKGQKELSTEEAFSMLKNKYYPGWIMKFTLKNVRDNSCLTEFKADLWNKTKDSGNRTLVDADDKGVLRFFIEEPKQKLSELFRTAEALEKDYKEVIFNYTISDIRFEDVYLKSFKKGE